MLIQEVHTHNGQGEVWADMTGEWAGCCEDIQTWTDAAWSKVAEEDAPPQIRRYGTGYPNYVSEFHNAGATQVNLETNTRRTARRAVIPMGFGTGKIMKDT